MSQLQTESNFRFFSNYRKERKKDFNRRVVLHLLMTVVLAIFAMNHHFFHNALIAEANSNFANYYFGFCLGIILFGYAIFGAYTYILKARSKFDTKITENLIFELMPISDFFISYVNLLLFWMGGHHIESAIISIGMIFFWIFLKLIYFSLKV